ncbi:hypothetical protein [Nakamurella sp.]|uniref:hypothetical protein n=1 Tax=Nakamurella sp. TaxID=1869182 RepID=UPI003B3B1D71
MPDTSLGITYPASTAHTRLWEHLQELAADVNAILVNRTPLRGDGALSSLYTLTATMADLAGATVTINVPTASAVFLARWTMAGQLMTAGNISAVSQLLVDNVAQTPQCIWNPANVTAATGSPRGGQSQQVSGTVSGAGNHIFKLQAQRVFPTGSSGDIRLDNIHTNLSVLVLPY